MSSKTQSPDKQARLAAALRQNLRRRKAATRNKSAVGAAPSVETDADVGDEGPAETAPAHPAD